ncbi:MAG TPA: UbiA family prenyltransferase [Pirellulales bacterium]|nr:UbiA family prenyltransferase [Pirellulales bacterium]
MIRPYLQLFRLPNVFTAIADVLMGYLFTHPEPQFGLEFALLVATSVLLYTAGMVLNDVFDYEVDKVERPERPLPSGAIALVTATRLGIALVALGLVCGGLAGLQSNFPMRSGAVTGALVVAIILYDRRLKTTVLGPVAMGACRALNVLLGMSTSSLAWNQTHVLVALGIGIYIAGLTWYARTEAMRSNRVALGMACAVLAIGIALLGHVTKFQQFAVEQARLWPILWLVLGASIVYRFVWGIVEPEPWRVQQAVKHGIMSLIVLDAVVAFSAAGQAATCILLLWIPAIALGRRLPST